MSALINESSPLDEIKTIHYEVFNMIKDKDSENFIRSDRWQKYMVESFGDSSIIRLIWENYGIQYSSGDPVSLFPIYNNAIEYVTNENESLFNTYVDYAIWRYFTGERSIPDSYFNESLNYCTASTLSDFENPFTLVNCLGVLTGVPLQKILNFKFFQNFWHIYV